MELVLLPLDHLVNDPSQAVLAPYHILGYRLLRVRVVGEDILLQGLVATADSHLNLLSNEVAVNYSCADEVLRALDMNNRNLLHFIDVLQRIFQPPIQWVLFAELVLYLVLA